MTKPSLGDTVNLTKSNQTTTGELCGTAKGADQRSQSTRKRRRLDPLTTNTEIPEKAQRREEELYGDALHVPSVDPGKVSPTNQRNAVHPKRPRQEDDVPFTRKTQCNRYDAASNERGISKSPTERLGETDAQQVQIAKEPWLSGSKRKKQDQSQQNLPAAQQDATVRRLVASTGRDEAARLRKTMQWLEDGARRLREDLASARTELHEEKRAAKIARRESDTAIREARASEAGKYQLIIAELKARLSRGTSVEAGCTSPSSAAALKVEFLKEEHHKREISALKKRLSEAEGTVRRLKWESLNLQSKFSCQPGGTCCAEVRRLETEVRGLRASNEKLDEKLRIALEAEKARKTELRIQHENYEADISSLRKSLRAETIKMMDELRGKSREIEKLSKLARVDASRKRRKTTSKDDDVTMLKLREGERNGPIRSASRTEKKFLTDDGHAVDSYIREVGWDRAITEVEVERLREFALEQQEVIEILRQAVKEKERKLEQLSNKRRKEEFYRQWLELEPVAEVDDEEDHEEGDSALSSAPSSLSPQPGGCGQWQGNGVTREAYEAVLIEIEELQSKLLHERQDLSTAKCQVRDLEKALLQETRCGNRNKEVNALNDKLRAAEEREATLLVELSELREQNELLEFRLLELEETSARRGSPDHTADSGIVSPEPMHVIKDQSNKQRSRAVATVIPYTNSTNLSNSRSVSPVPRKPPLSLQESGIFEEDDDEELEVELASCGTQTEEPAGELLQEVQRLQELRARIQERAAKVTNPVICPIDQSKLCSGLEVVNDMSVDSIVQLPSDQERIRNLEERLETYEVEEEKRLREKRLSKQREEELLDENYRLTERVYWLENELKNVDEVHKAGRNGSASSDDENAMEDERTEVIEAAVATAEMEQEVLSAESYDEVDSINDQRMNSDADGGIQENCGSERTVTMVTETLTCAKAVQTMEDSPDNTMTPCPVCRSRDGRNDGSDSAMGITAEIQHSDAVFEEVAKEAEEETKEEEEEGSPEIDDVDSDRGTLSTVVGSVSQVLVVPEEEEPVVSFTESEPKKKVIYFRWR